MLTQFRPEHVTSSCDRAVFFHIIIGKLDRDSDASRRLRRIILRFALSVLLRIKRIWSLSPFLEKGLLMATGRDVLHMTGQKMAIDVRYCNLVEPPFQSKITSSKPLKTGYLGDLLSPNQQLALVQPRGNRD